MSTSDADPDPAALALRWRALLALPGIGRRSAAAAAALIGGPAALAAAGPGALAAALEACARRGRTPSPEAVDAAFATAAAELARCRAAGVAVRARGAAGWPAAFERLGDPPLALFARGDLAAVEAMPRVAVVGTRQPSDFARAAARRIAVRCAEAGCAVVSGLALGCDAAAHEGCLEAGGRTAAILPWAIDRILPERHQDLARRLLAAGGALLSEHPPGLAEEPPAHAFVERDRLQAGWSAGLVLVESACDGGAMHAVGHARRLGLPLAVVEGAAPEWRESPRSAGNRREVAAGAAPLRDRAGLEAWLAGLRQA